MSKRTTKTEIHNFYCLNCGKNMPLARKVSCQRERLHRKKLYCPFCRLTVNMIECRNYEDKLEFLENFEKGLYKEEAEASIEFVNGGLI